MLSLNDQRPLKSETPTTADGVNTPSDLDTTVPRIFSDRSEVINLFLVGDGNGGGKTPDQLICGYSYRVVPSRKGGGIRPAVLIPPDNFYGGVLPAGPEEITGQDGRITIRLRRTHRSETGRYNSLCTKRTSKKD